MRALLDTNILARAARGGTSPAAELLKRLTQLPHVLISSPQLLSELARVLRYDRVRQMHGLDDEGISAYTQQIEAAALVVTVSTIASFTVPHDPDDTPVIAAAVKGQAEVICTLDRHLYNPAVQAHCSQHGIRIMTDVDLLKAWNSAGPA